MSSPPLGGGTCGVLVFYPVAGRVGSPLFEFVKNRGCAPGGIDPPGARGAVRHLGSCRQNFVLTGFRSAFRARHLGSMAATSDARWFVPCGLVLANGQAG